jgi:hypothetical protein
VDIIPQDKAERGPPKPDHFFDYLLEDRLAFQVDFELRVNIHQAWAKPSQVVQSPGATLWTRATSIPDHSHLCVYTSLMHRSKEVQHTEVHNWAYGGNAHFGERHIHQLQFPSSKPNCYLKVQVFHISAQNDISDDPLCEAVVPLWTWITKAYRKYFDERLRGKPEEEVINSPELSEADALKFLSRLEPQWITLSHPNNRKQHGQVNLSFELVPRRLAQRFPQKLGRKIGVQAYSQDSIECLEDPRPYRAPEGDADCCSKLNLLLGFRLKHFITTLWLVWLVLFGIGTVVVAVRFYEEIADFVAAILSLFGARCTVNYGTGYYEPSACLDDDGDFQSGTTCYQECTSGYSDTSGNFSTNDVTYECIDGELVPANLLTCLPEDCLPPALLAAQDDFVLSCQDGLSATANTLVTDGSCNASCPEGGPIELWTCAAGTFSGAILTCPPPCASTEVANSNYSTTGSVTGVTGDTVNITCDSGYNAFGGYTTATCEASGFFTTVECRESCTGNVPTGPEYGTECSLLVYNDTCNQTCATGYTDPNAANGQVYTCNASGFFSGTPLVCT